MNQSSIVAQSKNILPGYLGNMMRNVGKILAFQWVNYDRAGQALAAVLTLRPSWLLNPIQFDKCP